MKVEEVIVLENSPKEMYDLVFLEFEDSDGVVHGLTVQKEKTKKKKNKYRDLAYERLEPTVEHVQQNGNFIICSDYHTTLLNIRFVFCFMIFFTAVSLLNILLVVESLERELFDVAKYKLCMSKCEQSFFLNSDIHSILGPRIVPRKNEKSNHEMKKKGKRKSNNGQFFFFFSNICP